MANADSTETSPAQLDYQAFTISVDGDIWQIHAMAKGVEAIIERNNWEESEDICAAFFLIGSVHEKLKELAQRIDESCYTYIEKQLSTGA